MLKLIAAALLLLPLSLATASAAQVSLRYQAVMHAGASSSAPVLDDEKHVIGIVAFRGIALFEDSKPVVHRYDGWFDLREGNGRFHGYALWIFEDGATLRAAYDGEAKQGADARFRVTATFRDFSGTGRFARVKGEGAFAGERLEPIEKGGGTYVEGRLLLATGD